MQFVVLVAFALVFMPVGTPPWPVITRTSLVIAVVAGQAAVITVWALWATRRVLRELDRNPDHPGYAQTLHARDGSILGGLLLAGLVAGMWGTNWPAVVRSEWRLERIYGLDEFVILLPSLVSLLLAWTALFPADRAIRQLMMEQSLWDGRPARAAWNLRAYLVFLVRHQLLLVALPMMLIVIANDLAQEHVRALRRATRLFWADQAVVAAVAGVILFFSPVLLRYIWHTSTLPKGTLRDRLRVISERLGLRYRDILIWHSQGMVVNAAVMGVLPPVRYVLLSDGLLENLDDESIEAVFGHEAGHVRHLHIPFYLLFAIVSMLIVGGVHLLLFARPWLDRSYATPVTVAMIVAVWGLGFGWVSRRFERQADLFGARAISPDAGGCVLPCRVHHARAEDPSSTAGEGTGSTRGTASMAAAGALCATGAAAFGNALRRVARLNGIPEEGRSWRHSSIAGRIRFLEELAEDPGRIRRFGRVIAWTKAVLAAGTIIGLPLAVWLFI